MLAFRRLFAIGLVLIMILSVPLARAQSGALYFPATGHHLVDDTGFLSFWRDHNGAQLLGFPVTESLVADGQTVQYFERGRLEQATNVQTGATEVQNGRVGSEYADALWKQFPPARGVAPGVKTFEGTGHTLREPFLSFWEKNGGEAFFGAPISEPLYERTERGQLRVQYFERARLERTSSPATAPDAVAVSAIGRSLALLHNVDTAPLANWGAETYGPPAQQAPGVASLDITPTAPPPTATPQAAPAQPTAPAPTRAAPAAAPTTQPPAQRKPSSEGKLIVVNLTDQWMYVYLNGKQVYDAPVSSGRDGMETPTGTYPIYSKLEKQTMRGVTNGEPWVVPDVPNVMYINGGVALHGTYWHNRFGTGARLSHGCVNLPLDAAAWLYDWAPVGTPVRVIY